MAGRIARLSRLFSQTAALHGTPPLRLEEFEPRLMLSGMPTPVHAPPSVAQAITLSGASAVTGRTALLSVLGSDAAGEAKLTYNWSVASAPAGGSASFSANGTNAAKHETVTFNEAGTYNLAVKIIDTNGLSVTTTKALTVVSTLTSVSITTSAHQTVSTAAPLHLAGTSQSLVAQGLDQFGKVMAAQPSFKWTAVTSPVGATAPGLNANGASAAVIFHATGSYVLKAASATNANLSGYATLVVDPTVTTVTVTPGTASLAQGATQQFSAKAYDQFHNLMATQPGFTWTATGGTVTAGGLFTAGKTAGNFLITAKTGSVSASSTVAVQSGNTLGLQNAALASLVQGLDADGSISRNDMIQILTSVAANGAVTAAELSDLKTILSDATRLNMPGYVQVLAGDVISGNAANASYQGKTLGNLAVGSSGTQLTELIDKWFLGEDEPALTDPSFVYKTVAGSLFPQTPSHANEFQGELGDCYFISSLGTIADSNPAAIENMIVDNGDGTYTVRFYTGTYGSAYNASNGSWSDGFVNGAGTADYVTVDAKLPTTASGMLVYADYGASATNAGNSLWIPLLEKAYAEWNQTGKEGRNGQNSYASIEGGWMATVDAQVLGHNATDYSMTDADKQYAVSALAAHQAVTIGTAYANYGLVASHAYAITGYNASTDTFTLYNPWGFDQPGQLSWSQLEATCDGFVVASTAGSTSISSSIAKASFGPSSVSTMTDLPAAPPADRASSVIAVQAEDTSEVVRANQPCATAVANDEFWLAGGGLFDDGVDGGVFDLTPGAFDAVFNGEGSGECDAAAVVCLAV